MRGVEPVLSFLDAALLNKSGSQIFFPSVLSAEIRAEAPLRKACRRRAIGKLDAATPQGFSYPYRSQPQDHFLVKTVPPVIPFSGQTVRIGLVTPNLFFKETE